MFAPAKIENTNTKGRRVIPSGLFCMKICANQGMDGGLLYAPIYGNVYFSVQRSRFPYSSRITHNSLIFKNFFSKQFMEFPLTEKYTIPHAQEGETLFLRLAFVFNQKGGNM